MPPSPRGLEPTVRCRGRGQEVPHCRKAARGVGPAAPGTRRPRRQPVCLRSLGKPTPSRPWAWLAPLEAPRLGQDWGHIPDLMVPFPALRSVTSCEGPADFARQKTPAPAHDKVWPGPAGGQPQAGGPAHVVPSLRAPPELAGDESGSQQPLPWVLSLDQCALPGCRGRPRPSCPPSPASLVGPASPATLCPSLSRCLTCASRFGAHVPPPAQRLLHSREWPGTHPRCQPAGPLRASPRVGEQLSTAPAPPGRVSS